MSTTRSAVISTGDSPKVSCQLFRSSKQACFEIVLPRAGDLHHDHGTHGQARGGRLVDRDSHGAVDFRGIGTGARYGDGAACAAMSVAVAFAWADAIDEHLHLASHLLLKACGADLSREFHETGA